MQHHFNVEIAKKFGMEIAVFLDHMAFWITKNIANNHNYHDGFYWTRNTMESYTHIFPYMSTMQVRKVLRNCEKYGLINTGNYNETKYDRTGWYSLTEYAAKLLNISICSKQQMDEVKTTNRKGQNNKPIPCTNTVTNTSRERARKKRVLLPDDFILNEQNKIRCKERNIDVSVFTIKFRLKNKGKLNEDWQNQAAIWIESENTEKSAVTKTELHSNVMEYGPGHPTWEDNQEWKRKQEMAHGSEISGNHAGRNGLYQN